MISDLQPDFYKDVYEFEQLAKVEDKSFNDFDNYLSRQLINLFVSKTDADGISTLESQYGIPIDSSKSLDDRRYQVLIRLLPPQPITFKYFKKLLTTMNLEVDSSVDAINSIYKAVVESDKVTISDINRLNDVLNRYVPSHLLKIIYRYQNAQSQFNNYLGVANNTELIAHSDYVEGRENE
ncbi:putative phage tail protein [Apilactobacillus timberlakei]|uniref:DUF2313 domain-containing protein n=1 Tax=Apilactobacillus timberlakei TaxID=2008380 RepID=A0ABY2YRE8_9LACO|nr:putative phage tail protein [Apilactobacillus timberlakei]TPR12405.1 DUF2313 domain-containing protein [Apilactobacillus timberlakei]TPR12991.1 DUF2313 domain-containing protein [Apilactobacillus timberlakei]